MPHTEAYLSDFETLRNEAKCLLISFQLLSLVTNNYFFQHHFYALENMWKRKLWNMRSSA